MIFRPVITEKSLLDQQQGKYHFFVNTEANKFQIRQSFIALFGVKPLAINTSVKKFRTKMDWKRRVTLVKGPQKKVIITVPKDTKLNLLATDTKKTK
ncbi:50S ribosomal protein L23 [Patescibacteria group bacterium]|nr:50S ribosomal protein L23 [Patescibacteria group bacterium]